MWVTKSKTRRGIRYRFFEQYKDPLTEKWHNVSVSFGKDNRNVRKKAQIILNEKIEKHLISSTTNGHTNITLKNLCEKYLELAKNSLALNTYNRVSAELRKAVREMPKGIVASRITPQYLTRYFNGLLYNPDRPLQNSTVRNLRTNLSQVYEFGINYGYVSVNPVKKAKFTKRSENKRKHNEIENKYLEDDEFKKILLDCDQHHRHDLKRLFIWLYLTGMRIGEASTIQYKNIKYDKATGNYFAEINGSLTCDRSIKWHPRYFKSNSAKTVNSNRTIVLPPTAVRLVKEYAKGKKPDDYIFINTDPRAKQGFFSTGDVCRVLSNIAKRQNIKNKIMVSHIFRHTHVSKLAEAGVPLPLIQKRVGHGSSRVTTQIYLHVTSKMQKDMSNSIERFASFLDDEKK